MISTKHGTPVRIIDLFPSFGDLERVVIEFEESGFQTFINADDLVETEKREIREAIDKLKKEEGDV